MTNDQERESVSRWIQDMRHGSDSAAANLWDRYFLRLMRLADSRMRSIPGVSTGEDVALSALKSVMIGLKSNQYPDLTSAGLWPLLVNITLNKTNSEIRRTLAKKRPKYSSVGQEVLLSLVSDDAGHQFSIELLEELERLVCQLRDERLKTLAILKLSGHTNEEVASQLNCSVRTVIRKVALIRRDWEERGLLQHRENSETND